MVVRIHSCLLSPGTPKDHSRVAGIIVLAPFFPMRLLPVETDMGESSVSGRRIGLNHDLRDGPLLLGRGVEQSWLKDRLSRFWIRACSAPFAQDY